MLGLLIGCSYQPDPEAQVGSDIDSNIVATLAKCDVIEEVWEFQATVANADANTIVHVILETTSHLETHDLQLMSWEPETEFQEHGSTLQVNARSLDQSGNTTVSCNDNAVILFEIN